MSDKDTIYRQEAIDALFELYEYQRNIDPTEAADLVRQGIYLAEKKIEQLPSAQPERKAPISYKEQLSLDCSFCRQHECGDTLYESANWDGGVGFDYIRNIQFCPICGRKLYNEDAERCEE